MSILDNQSNTLPINSQVIVRSNDEEPVWVGKLIRYEEFGINNSWRLPVVKNEETGKEFIVAGIIAPYSPALKIELDSMSGYEGWLFLQKKRMMRE